MREIKFRAWTNAKKMVYTHGIEEGDHQLDLFFCGYPELYIDVMQYVGVKDEDNNKIYEGDILENDKNGRGEVIFFNAIFWVQYKTGVLEVGVEHGVSKVIGNIYENPELLKPKN